MNARLKLAAAAAVLALAAPAAAFADDRKPEGEELAAITEALNAQGYSSWDEIEWSHGKWDVNDAEYSDGKDYDLLLDPDTLQVVEKE